MLCRCTLRPRRDTLRAMKLTSGQHIHFLGIGGIGMSGIAEILHARGFTVTGTDVVNNKIAQRLAKLGVQIHIGHTDLDAVQQSDIVVTSSAIHADNPELIAAKQAEKKIICRAEMLAAIMQSQRGVAIAGTHGKTTTTSLVASVFIAAEQDPSFVIGGVLHEAGSNAKLGEGEFFIAEADESDASFLYLQPEIAVVTNIGADHMGTYDDDFAQLEKTFIKFLDKLPADGHAILCCDDKVVVKLMPQIKKPILTYGFSNDADMQLSDFQQDVTKSLFVLHDKQAGKKIPITVNLPGQHNALNAAASYIVAKLAGIDIADIQRGLAEFSGVGRRFQMCPNLSTPAGQATLIDDYGHHPEEISATLKAIRLAWPERRLVLAFQPHRYSRTKALLQEFAKVLAAVDVLLLLDVYSAGEAVIEGADGPSLCRAISKHGKKPIYIEQLQDLPKMLSQVTEDNDILLLQGAGSIGSIAAELAEKGMLYAA